MATEAEIARVRRFNRTVTQRVGALHDQYLARQRPLAASRMLWEIGAATSNDAEVRVLRRRLDLDAGYTSRLLKSLESDGLIELTSSATDGRIRVARLTAKGVRERAHLDGRSDALAASMLDRLSDAQAATLLDAMDVVQRLLTSAAVEVRTVDPAGADARQCLRAYYAELNDRSETGFDPAAGISAEPRELTPPAGRFVIAYLRDDPIGCGAVKHHDTAPSEIKRMWVSPTARGLGVARRILTELEADAGLHGALRVQLETNRHLVEAIGLYISAGYVEVPAFNKEPFADHWFSKDL